MNANTALKINDAISQAVLCGEARYEIEEQVAKAIRQAYRLRAQLAAEEALRVLASSADEAQIEAS